MITIRWQICCSKPLCLCAKSSTAGDWRDCTRWRSNHSTLVSSLLMLAACCLACCLLLASQRSLALACILQGRSAFASQSTRRLQCVVFEYMYLLIALLICWLSARESRFRGRLTRTVSVAGSLAICSSNSITSTGRSAACAA